MLNPQNGLGLILYLDIPIVSCMCIRMNLLIWAASDLEAGQGTLIIRLPSLFAAGKAFLQWHSPSLSVKY